MKKLPLTGFLTLSIAAPVCASWHYATITLPRVGSWSTISRSASGGTQKTQVTRNPKPIYSKIVRDNGISLSSYQFHFPGNGTVRTFYTGVKKSNKIKARYKTAATNFNTCRVTIGWSE